MRFRRCLKDGCVSGISGRDYPPWGMPTMRAARTPVRRAPRSMTDLATQPETSRTPRVSVCVIAYHEAAKIREAVSSVLWADDAAVADSHSTDGTSEAAQALGARVLQIEFKGFAALRNRP